MENKKQKNRRKTAQKAIKTKKPKNLRKPKSETRKLGKTKKNV
jgi:hypothetical protein